MDVSRRSNRSKPQFLYSVDLDVHSHVAAFSSSASSKGSLAHNSAGG